MEKEDKVNRDKDEARARRCRSEEKDMEYGRR